MTLTTDAPAPITAATHESVRRRTVRIPAPIGARFPRHLADTVIESELRTRIEARPAHPVGARFPRLNAERRAEVTLVEVADVHPHHPAVGARFPR